MKPNRYRHRVVVLSGILALSSCSTGPDFGDAPPLDTDTSTVIKTPGGLPGLVDQVDRARDVGADLEQRNTSLEDSLP